MKNFAVIGLGPIGSILASHLIKSGQTVTLVDILQERLQAMKIKGLKIRDPKNQIIGDFEVFPEDIAFSSQDLKTEPDYIFICTKAYILGSIVSSLSQVFRSPPHVVVFQNGLDNEDEVADGLGKEKVFRCVCNYAGGMVSENEVEVTFFNRPNYIGVVDNSLISPAQELAGILTGSGLETAYTDDIKKLEWNKAILNACLAPVSAATGLTMKGVMDYAPTREMVEILLREGLEVAYKAGVRFPDDFFELGIAYVSKGGHHKPSMLVDIENGARTEIDYINGKIVEYAEKYGVPAPNQKMITAIVKGLEQKNLRDRE